MIRNIDRAYIDYEAEEDARTLIKPTFTQEMSDKRELPMVGSKAIFGYADFELFNGLKIGSVVTVICHDVNNGTPVAIFKHDDGSGGFDVAMGGGCSFEPILTPRDKAVSAIGRHLALNFDCTDKWFTKKIANMVYDIASDVLLKEGV